MGCTDGGKGFRSGKRRGAAGVKKNLGIRLRAKIKRVQGRAVEAGRSVQIYTDSGVLRHAGALGRLTHECGEKRKADATTNCWRAMTRDSVAVAERGSTIPITMFFFNKRIYNRQIGLGCVPRRAAVTIPAIAYTNIRQQLCTCLLPIHIQILSDPLT